MYFKNICYIKFKIHILAFYDFIFLIRLQNLHIINYYKSCIIFKMEMRIKKRPSLAKLSKDKDSK